MFSKYCCFCSCDCVFCHSLFFLHSAFIFPLLGCLRHALFYNACIMVAIFCGFCICIISWVSLYLSLHSFQSMIRQSIDYLKFIFYLIWQCLWFPLCYNLKAATRGVLWKKMLLKISQYSQKSTCARVSFY